MAREAYTSQILGRINKAAFGDVFLISDFIDIAPEGAVKMALSRLANEKIIRRVMRGVYDKPKYSNLLHEFAAPCIDKISEALGRSNGWTIIPYGDAAANMLGLSTQVPAKWVFATDGPYKSYMCGNTEIQFKHVANKDICGLSFKSALVVQALKVLGKNNVGEPVVSQLASTLTVDEKRTLLRETHGTTAWVFRTIQRICI
ncbi:MAG TPA: DUF6088 family protein [Methanocorpusculum sp.]|nr:DUF6088 family protein [Methanocorpusculum sp.]